jgi:hypothetical protein
MVMPNIDNSQGEMPRPTPTELETPARELVEHGDLFGEDQRIVEGERVGKRSQSDLLRSLRRGADKDAGKRRHADRVPVMLGEVIAIDSRGIGGFDQLQPLLIELCQRRVAAVEMIEDSDFHGPSPAPFSMAARRAICGER